MCTIGKRQLHRFHNDVGAVGRIHRAEIEVLENIQNLRHMNSARTWGREPGDGVAAIDRHHRGAFLCLVVGEVLLGQ